MIDIAQLLGQPAVSLRTAERTGTVKGLRFHGDRVVSVDIGNGRTVPVESVRTFEGDALTYETEADPTGVTSAEPESVQPPVADASATGDDGSEPEDADTLAGELPLPDAPVEVLWHGSPIGTVLLSDMGDDLGKVAGMQIDATGLVTEIADDHGHTYGGDRLMTVGSFATIIVHRDDGAT